jgi:predicted small secreted protein
MAKFILGVVLGLAIGLFYSSYFSKEELSDLTVKARGELGKHMPIHD